MSNKEIAKETLHLIDYWLNYKQYIKKIPSLSVGIFFGDEVIFRKDYGNATKDILYRISSQSKLFAAACIFKLIEKGDLGLDEPATKFLPWFKGDPTITIRHLLTHSAGLSRDGNTNYFNDDIYPTIEEVKNMSFDELMIYKPDAHWKYSNIGIILLGEVITSITQKSYAESLKDLVLEPLGLKNTYSDYDESLSDRLAEGYGREYPDKEREKFNNIKTNGFECAAGICTTADDLIEFYKIFSTDLSNFFSKPTIMEITRSQFKEKHYDWGLCLERFKVETLDFVGHRGTFTGYNTMSGINLSNNIIIVLLSNAIDAPVFGLLNNIASILDFFITNKIEPESTISKDALLDLRGYYSSRWGTDLLSSVDGRLVSINADLGNPLDDLNIYKHIKDLEFRVPDKEHFSKVGEVLSFPSKQCLSLNGIILDKVRIGNLY